MSLPHLFRTSETSLRYMMPVGTARQSANPVRSREASSTQPGVAQNSIIVQI